MASPMEDADMEKQGVRFSSRDEEIAPDETPETMGDQRKDLDDRELQQLKTSLKNSMQSARAQHHAFEPVSLPGSQPASRVPSGTTTPSRRHLPAGSTELSPAGSPPPAASAAVHSPPLTPAATKSKDAKAAVPGYVRPGAEAMTPQRSASPQRGERASDKAGVSSHPKQQPIFSIGSGSDSQPQSKDQSPAGTPGTSAPGTPRPKTPSEIPARKPSAGVRQVQSDDSQYRFGNRDPAIGFSSSGQTNISSPLPSTAPTLPRSNASGISLADSANKSYESKRSSIFGGAKKEHEESSSKSGDKEKDSHSSKSNLKRFFKIGEHKHHHREKSGRTNGDHTDGTRTPPRDSVSGPSVPFADDHGLQSKYGKFGKMLGSGAGGSVRLMKRTGDGVVFAVKQFRDRHPYENEKEYNKKVTAEFCIGSTLHHGNIIETIDIVHEKGKWYEVMEYAPFDLFATVMTGKMGREEITCTTMQILAGVLYFHSMGLAHRDLKLDNVVINDQGIMKLIDFGSAVVFRYPFEDDIVLSTGVVGSDPYLAPEVYDQAKYDPRMADIWSIAIIFCCMTLRRFPWKAPRISDNSYRLFISPPDPEQDKFLEAQRRGSARNSVASVDDSRKGVQSEPASRNPTGNGNENETNEESHKHHHHHHHNTNNSQSDSVSRASTQTDPSAQPTIKGPLRLLRLLPRESRHIIGRMLELDPRKRADMDEILADPWVQNSLVCRQEENGVVVKAPGHVHALQPSNAGK